MYGRNRSSYGGGKGNDKGKKNKSFVVCPAAGCPGWIRAGKCQVDTCCTKCGELFSTSPWLQWATGKTVDKKKLQEIKNKQKQNEQGG